MPEIKREPPVPGAAFHQIPMSGVDRRSEKMRAALLLFSLPTIPTICHADVGDLGRVAVVAIGIFLAIWGGLSVGVFLLSRRMWAARRALGLASLFFVSPALFIGLVAAPRMWRGKLIPAGTFRQPRRDGLAVLAVIVRRYA